MFGIHVLFGWNDKRWGILYKIGCRQTNSLLALMLENIPLCYNCKVLTPIRGSSFYT